MIQLDVDDLNFLEGQKQVIENALPSPRVRPPIKTMPATEPFGQAAPFAAMLCNVQNSVKHLRVRLCQNVMSESEMRQKQAKNRSLQSVNEESWPRERSECFGSFEPVFNDISLSVKVLTQPEVRDFHITPGNREHRLDNFVVLRCHFQDEIIAQ